MAAKTASKKSGAAAKRKAAPKKAAAKKAPAKKAAVKKAAIKKAPAKKAVSKKAAPKKAVAKSPAVKKAAPRKSAATKSVARKSAVKKTASKKTALKTNVSRTPVSKQVASKKTAAKKAPAVHARKAPATKQAARKAPSKTTKTSTKLSGFIGKVLKAITPAAAKPAAQTRLRETPVRTGVRAAAAKPAAAKPARNIRNPVRETTSPHRPDLAAPRKNVPPSGALHETKPNPAVDAPLSEAKLREDIRTAVLYLEAWLRSSGTEATPAVSEFAAPAEAAHAEVWRWIDKEARFEDDRTLTPELFEAVLQSEMGALRDEVGAKTFDTGSYTAAAQLFQELALAPDFGDFPTPPSPPPIG